jgi:hypothetical protein
MLKETSNMLLPTSCFQLVANPRLHWQLVATDEQHPLNMLKEHIDVLYSGHVESNIQQAFNMLLST